MPALLIILLQEEISRMSSRARFAIIAILALSALLYFTGSLLANALADLAVILFVIKIEISKREKP